MLLFLSMVDEKKLIDISEPAMWHEYWSEEFPVQQLSLWHLNVELNDCIGSLLRLGPNVNIFKI